MNTIQKVFKKLSIFLVFAMVIGLMTPGVVLAKKKDYKVYVDYSDGLVIVYKGKKYGVVNKKGKIIIPIVNQVVIREYDDLESRYKDNFFVKKGGKWGLVNKQNKVLIKLQYDNIERYGDKHYRVSKKNKRGDVYYGIINRNNKAVLPIKYSDIGDLYGGWAPVKKGKKYGFINDKFKTIIKPQYDFVSTYISEGYAAVTK